MTNAHHHDAAADTTEARPSPAPSPFPRTASLLPLPFPPTAVLEPPVATESCASSTFSSAEGDSGKFGSHFVWYFVKNGQGGTTACSTSEIERVQFGIERKKVIVRGRRPDWQAQRTSLE